MTGIEHALALPQLNRRALADTLCSWAQDYIDAGWEVIPVPFMEKTPIPAGCTGYRGKAMPWGQLEAGIRKGIPFNPRGGQTRFMACGGIALRMPAGVIAIDIDAYKEAGAASLRDLEKAAGQELPPTWVNTARSDGVSGHYFYRVRKGVQLAPNPFPGIEIIQRHHRYAVAAPSLHPSGKPYAWYTPDGRRSDDFPSVAELPWLFGGDDE